MNLIVDKARIFAAQAHGEQLYGRLPYIVHLEAVHATLLRFGFEDDEELRAAAYLHDVVEDTPVDAGLIEEHFGGAIAKLVLAVTNEPGRNRLERHRMTYPKVRAAGKRAVILKLADRIANVEACIRDNVRLFAMYRHEYAGFEKALKVLGDCDAMWRELSELLQ